jgi:hypothetical protein
MRCDNVRSNRWPKWACLRAPAGMGGTARTLAGSVRWYVSHDIRPLRGALSPIAHRRAMTVGNTQEGSAARLILADFCSRPGARGAAPDTLRDR